MDLGEEPVPQLSLIHCKQLLGQTSVEGGRQSEPTQRETAGGRELEFP